MLADRANYGRLKPVMHAIAQHAALELQVIATGSTVLERFQQPVEIMRRDGFRVDSELFIALEGSRPVTMAKSVGHGIGELAGEFLRLNPDFVLLIGDRHEVLAAALAAAYMNIPIVHFQGGEVSGSIDESARHAISKFAQYHVPATARAAEYLVRMGEDPATILTVGCPSSDIARTLDLSLTCEMINLRGTGAAIDVTRPFLLAVFHPTTTEFGSEREQMSELLEALGEVRMQTILLWPNIDAGGDHISKMTRIFRDHNQTSGWLRTQVNFPPDVYLKLLANAACAVGNSSSFVRDASYFGTPVVLVGNRQRGREMCAHVTPTPCEAEAISRSIRDQIANGRYPMSNLYGDGFVAGRVIEALVRIQPYVQKQLAYVHRDLRSGEGRAP